RRFGRIAVSMTFILWALVVAAVVLWFVWREPLLYLAATPIALWIVAAVLAFYAVLWFVLALDTLRLVRLVRTEPSARPAIAMVAIVAMLVASGGAAYGAYLTTTAGGFVSGEFISAPPAEPVNGRYNIMLLGGDSGA